MISGIVKESTEQTLLGVIGSGKTFAMANVIAENGFAISGKSIDEIDIEMLERVFEKSSK